MLAKFNRTGRFLSAVLVVWLAGLWAGTVEAQVLEAASLRAKLELVVRTHLIKGFQQANLSGELVALHVPPMVDQLDPSATVRPLQHFSPNKVGGRHVIPVQLVSLGKNSVRINVIADCVAVVDGWVTRRHLKRGAVLSPEDFERRTIRVSRREQEYVSGATLPEGFRLSANLAPGRFLRQHHLELIPAVQRGEQVMVHFNREQLTLVTPGTARSDGRIGDVIPVVAKITGKRFQGRLVSPGVVVVE